MDNQSQQPDVSGQPDTPPVQPMSPVGQTASPKRQLTDRDAQSLLMTSNISVSQRPKTKAPITLLIVAAILVLLVIAASFAIGGLKRAPSSGPTNSTGNQSNASSGQKVTNQINQDVNSCSNPVNAATVC